MTAIPVSSDEQYTNPKQPHAADQLEDLNRRLTILERSQLEQRVRAIEEFLFG